MAEKTFDEKLDELERNFDKRLRDQFNQFLKAALTTGLVVTGVLVTVAVSAAGNNGQDGSPGRDGKDAFAPAGIVIASRKECKELTPKDGWTEYKKAYGRVIVGVGEATIKDNKRKFLFEEQSGNWVHVLTKPQMPKHEHSFTYKPVRKDSPNDFVADAKEHGIATLTEDTGPAGGGAAHNNMPPYIALYFCKKEG